MSLKFWQLVEVWPRRRWNLRKILLHGKGIFLSYRAKWISPNFNKRTRCLDKLSGEWLFIKGYRWVKNDGNEVLKLYRVIYPESWSQLWLRFGFDIILAIGFTVIVKRSWKNMYFHPKWAWPPASYDVISRNHNKWPSLNLICAKEERTATENVRCWLFIL